MASGV